MPEIGAPHKLTHQNGGNDEISVQGLSGTLADTQTPAPHKTSHQNGGADEISLAGLGGQLVFIPYNAKIADINEDDADQHFLDLATPLSETRTIVAVILRCNKIAGTGLIYLFPNEGTAAAATDGSYLTTLIIIASATQRILYQQTSANSDWDIYCMGYVVVGG